MSKASLTKTRAQQLLRMKSGDEIDEGKWYYDGNEWKFSPYGYEQDYETGCEFFSREELLKICQP